ncbi:MAG: S-methyl-5-thioribose-1-phosphate isomerase [Candidatus Latescibacteria bacterium]|nr:S-methyl-5-thioribose-1-phosphate isomerase [Candidatus Latescibacterota bacterium]
MNAAQPEFPFPVVAWRDGAVALIDQRRLPGELVTLVCPDVPALAEAIRTLAVRGAPAIGVAAAWGLALSWELSRRAGRDAAAALAVLERDRALLAATRPTAVNLFWALDRLAALAGRLVAAGAGAPQVGAALVAAAADLRERDVATGRALGAFGAALLPDPATVLTHCNAGGLATGGYGTALGVVYAAVDAGKRVRVYADETRPLLQGARLTAWELQARGVPVTLICEGAAGSLLRTGTVDAVITGADRIARNGDVANKIGTYPLAVLARTHGVPFYVAAPLSTFDPGAPDGSAIVVEERDPREITEYQGVAVAPAGVGAWNPAFDVTPGDLVTAIVTERGVHRPPYGASLAGIGPDAPDSLP